MTSKILNSLPHLANDSVTKQVTDILSDLIVTGKIVGNHSIFRLDISC